MLVGVVGVPGDGGVRVGQGVDHGHDAECGRLRFHGDGRAGGGGGGHGGEVVHVQIGAGPAFAGEFVEESPLDGVRAVGTHFVVIIALHPRQERAVGSPGRDLEVHVQVIAVHVAVAIVISPGAEHLGLRLDHESDRIHV